jgi:hypothetical protein
MTGALVPMVVAASTLPAAAAGNSLTVTTISRHGVRISESVTLENLSSFQEYQATSGKALYLPRGQYAVITDVEDSTTDTIGSRVVNVSGTTNVTIDARQGRPVNVSLNVAAPGTFQRYVDARVCAGNGPAQVEASNNAGSLFVIPDSSKVFDFAYLAAWQGKSNYAVSGADTDGVPAAPGGSYRTASLARLNIQVRSGTDTVEPTTNVPVTVQPDPATDGCQTDLWGPVGNYSLPAATSVSVSPGDWTARTDPSGDGLGEMTSPVGMLAGHTYWQTFNQAVWGPVVSVPEVWEHQISLDAGSLIADPTPGVLSFWSTLGTYELSQGSKVLHKQTLTEYGVGPSSFSTRVSAAGWYNLTVSAHRYLPGTPIPASILSNDVALSFHFYVNPAVQEIAPVYLTRFFPGGLNAANQAPPNTTTGVTLMLDREDNDPSDIAMPTDSASSVKVWASVNGGATWRAVTVKKVDGHWVAEVPDPASGVVSLRSEVTDPHGNSAVETVYRAYAIG